MPRPEAGEEAEAPLTPRASTRRKTLQMVLGETPGAMTLRLGRPPVVEAPAPAPEPPRPEIVTAPVLERALELIWFSPALPARAHRIEGWTPEPPPPEGTEPAPVRVVVRALRQAPAPASLPRVLFASVGEDGALVPPLVALSGELGLVFDEIEALRATITAARPSARADARLAGQIDLAEEMLRADLGGSPDVAAELTAQVRDAWAQANPILPAAHLAQQVERALLGRRAYQRRDLLGKRWIRALLRPPPGDAPSITMEGDPPHPAAQPVPAYLPAAAGSPAAALPPLPGPAHRRAPAPAGAVRGAPRDAGGDGARAGDPAGRVRRARRTWPGAQARARSRPWVFASAAAEASGQRSQPSPS